MSKIIHTMYAVQNDKDQFLRSKGFSGSGNSWVDSLDTARLYGKPRAARARITFFAKNYPEFPVPKLVALHITEMEVIDETERIENLKKNRASADDRRELRSKKAALDKAQSEYDEANR